MGLWQWEAADRMAAWLRSRADVARWEVVGSLRDPARVDAYSDVDMHVWAAPGAAIDVPALVADMGRTFAGALGYEVHGDDARDVLRVCLVNGWRFDLTIEYPEGKPTATDGRDARARVVDEFWFLAAMVFVKLGRADHLIASHLALEMCQSIVVLQMLRRDEERHTNIHRHGGGEEVPVLRALRAGCGGGGGTEAMIRGIAMAAAEEMDAWSAGTAGGAAKAGALRGLFGMA